MNKHVDILVPGMKQRLYSFKKGKDHLAVWKKPRRPKEMSVEEYKRYPNTIQIREFKKGGVVYMTTLLDCKRYSKHELKNLYERRWEIETNLNSIKTTLGMDTLSCKTPSMVRKEIGVYLLGYTIIRELMTQACILHNKLPWQVSFKTTVQILEEFVPCLLYHHKKNKTIYNEVLRLIAKRKVGNRSGRVEPRLLKQRRQKFPNLKQPRSIERQKLITLAQERSRTIENDFLEA